MGVGKAAVSCKLQAASNTQLRAILRRGNSELETLNSIIYAYSETGHHQCGGVIFGHVSFFFNYSLTDPGIAGDEYFSVKRQLACYGD